MKNIAFANRLFATIALAAMCAFALSQEKTNVQEQMHMIKLNEKYIYGEASNDNKNLAYDMALQRLVESINECRVADGKSFVSKSDVTVHVKQLQHDRGGIMLVFVYMEFDKAMSLMPKRNEITPDSTDISNMADIGVHVPIGQIRHDIGDSRTLTYIIENVLEREMVDEVYLYLEAKEIEGKLSRIGKARNMNSIPDDAYLVVFNREMSVMALLSPIIDGLRTNLNSNTTDNLRNYSGCGVLWFK